MNTVISLKDANRLKRARHAVWENQRTLQAKEALIAGELETFGRLVNASHVSLEHDYEVMVLSLIPLPIPLGNKKVSLELV